MVFSSESSMEDEEDEVEEEDSGTEGSWSLERLGFVESKEEEDIVNMM